MSNLKIPRHLKADSGGKEEIPLAKLSDECQREGHNAQPDEQNRIGRIGVYVV